MRLTVRPVRLIVRPVRSQQTLSPSSLPLAANFYRSRGAHGTLSVWTLSSMYPRLTVSPLSWWLLTMCPSTVFSFQLRTLVLPERCRCIRFPCVLKAWHLLQMSSDYGSEFASPRLPPSNAPTLHVRSPPLSQRSGRTGQHHLETLPSYVLQLRAGQLVHTPPASWVRPPCHNGRIPLLRDSHLRPIGLVVDSGSRDGTEVRRPPGSPWVRCGCESVINTGTVY